MTREEKIKRASMMIVLVETILMELGEHRLSKTLLDAKDWLLGNLCENENIANISRAAEKYADGVANTNNLPTSMRNLIETAYLAGRNKVMDE